MVKMMVYSAKPYEREWFDKLREDCGMKDYEISYVDARLSISTVSEAKGCIAVCCFVNDDLSGPVLDKLVELGVKGVCMRCAGFDRIDLDCPSSKKLTFVRVPSYSPEAVAEYAVTLAMSLNRKVVTGSNKCKINNFALTGQMGFDLNGKTVGVIGTGKIGGLAAKMFMKGFECKIICYDVYKNQALIDMGCTYVSLDELYAKSDIITLHIPLLKETSHMINLDSMKKMKKHVIIVNTGRGGLIDTEDAIKALNQKLIGGLALDVYENEEPLFFEDLQNQVVNDDTFAKLVHFNNVIVTGHQAFFTQEAMTQIVSVTYQNLKSIASNDFSTVKTNIVPIQS